MPQTLIQLDLVCKAAHTPLSHRPRVPCPLSSWPTATVLFPVEMYRKIHKPGKWKTVGLELLNVFCGLITVSWGA